MTQSSSSGSSSSVSTGTGRTVQSVTMITEQLEHALKISTNGERPRTVMGPQGDHTSAYALIKKALFTNIEGSSPEDAVRRLLVILDPLRDNATDELQTKFDEIISKITQTTEDPDYFTDKEKELIAEQKEFTLEFKSKLLRAIELKNITYLKQIISEIAKLYLSTRNKKLYVSFPREGNVAPPDGEGARIKSALQTLHKLHSAVAEDTKEDMKLTVPELKQVSEAMFNLFWYPKIPDRQLIVSGSSEAKAIIREKGYNKGTEFRDNNLESLYKVTAEHLLLIFTCFPLLFGKFTIEEITNNFLKLVANEGKIGKVVANWGMTKPEYETFLKGVLGKMPFYWQDLYPGASRSDSEEHPAADDVGESTKETKGLVRA